MTLTQRRSYTRAALALAAALLTSGAPSKASMTLQLYDSKVVFRNDGLNTVGVLVNECQDSSQMLWIDDSALKPFKFNADGTWQSYPLREEGFSPLIQKALAKLDAWTKLPAAEKVKAAHPSSRAALKDALAEKCVIKRVSESVRQPEPQVDADGCTQGRSMVYVKQGGFLGMGGKNVPIGCMTQEEMNRWNIEQQNARPTYIPPAPTYQPPRTIRCSTQYGVTSCY